jgi:hypothetical protein
MVEKNEYADQIAEAIRKMKRKLKLINPEEEVMVIHVASRAGERESESQLRIYPN